ncbi:hypothetical protein ABZ135_18375 [Streptomyces sp. NPDC006339]|uniref:hypothetical protein n=1 Tax=Streptomyces sp. NPDC006339 TaxID=3156755 RepID=UPI0033A4A1B8
MNLLASVLRTAVPLLAGWILTVTGALGIEADQAAVVGGVTAAVTLAYYVVLRLAELGAERIGWEPLRLAAGLLLGWARPPAYTPPRGTTVVRVHFDKAALRADIGDVLRAAARDADGYR